MTPLLLWIALNLQSPQYQTIRHAKALAEALHQQSPGEKKWKCESTEEKTYCCVGHYAPVDLGGFGWVCHSDTRKPSYRRPLILDRFEGDTL